MGFWLFVFIMDLVAPFTMIGFGKLFMKNAPKQINSAFGYRTHMSSINRDTWEFAHKYAGKIWYICGLFSLPPTIIVMLSTLDKSRDTIGNIGAAVEAAQMILLLAVIPATEIALRKHFDKSGRRKEP